jgi:hypothetical protein
MKLRPLRREGDSTNQLNNQFLLMLEMKTESHIKQELLADLGGHCALPCCHPL